MEEHGDRCECNDPVCGVIFLPDYPESGVLTVEAGKKFWTFVHLALSEIADPDSKWPGSQRLAASRAVEAIRGGLHP